MSNVTTNNTPVQITGIKIAIGTIEASVSLDEAKKLKEALDEIFPAVVEPVQIHWHHQPYHIPSQPYSPNWTFSETSCNGDDLNCTASLSIEANGNIIT